MRVRRQLTSQPRGVEPELAGVLDQVIVLERELALEQPIVHLPELPLRAGRFGRFGGVLRVQVQLGERKVAEHKPEARAQALPHLLHDRVGATAMRALEVAVLDQRHRGVRRTLHVIPLAHVALKLRKDLVVQHHLVAAHRTPVGRIEREYHRPAAEVPQRDRLVRGAVQREVRCLGPGYEGTTGGASHGVRHKTAPFVCREASRVLDRPKPDIYVRDSSYQIAHLQHKDASCVNTRVRVLVPVLMLGMICPLTVLVAQDAFEIAVYSAETAPRKAWELETHFNYIARGTTAFDGPVAPSERQFHLAVDLTSVP